VGLADHLADRFRSTLLHFIARRFRIYAKFDSRSCLRMGVHSMTGVRLAARYHPGVTSLRPLNASAESGQNTLCGAHLAGGSDRALAQRPIDRYRVANAPPRLLHKIGQRLPVNWEGGEIAGAGEPRSWESESSLSAFGSWRHLENDVTHLA